MGKERMNNYKFSTANALRKGNSRIQGQEEDCLQFNESEEKVKPSLVGSGGGGGYFTFFWAFWKLYLSSCQLISFETYI